MNTIDLPATQKGNEHLKLIDKEAFEESLKKLPHMPAWLLQAKRDAWARFQDQPLPTRGDERWRFGNVRDLDPAAFSLAPATTHSDPETSATHAFGETSAAFSFVDDVLVSQKPLVETVASQGVVCLPLAKALAEVPELLEPVFLRHWPDLGSEAFQSLHTALFSNGLFVYVPEGVEVPHPIVAKHTLSPVENLSVFPHTLVVAGRNSRVTVIDNFIGSGDSRQLALGATAVVAADDAQVHYQAVQEWNSQTLAFHLQATDAGKNARVNVLTAHMGCKHLRNEQHVRITGPGADVNVNSLSVAHAEQEIDQRTLQTHYAPDARSDLLFKNALLDESRSIFSGLIKVEQDAQRTDAYQTNRNLLLSPNAEANSLPGLEILANDVKCSHGATTGQIDENELFYFLARGIPRRKAQELLVFGFFEEIISQIELPELADHVRAVVEQKFHY